MKGIPRLKFESTVTNESLVMVVVISVAPFPVNSTSEKEGKNKFSFGRIFSLNLHHHPSIIWQRVKSVSVVLLPYPGGKHTCSFFLDLGFHFDFHFKFLSLHLEDLGVYLLREAALTVQLGGDEIKHTNVRLDK